MSKPTVSELIDAVEDVLSSTLELARGIDPELASTPTGCPGWTVQDQLAHMVGLEQVLGGAPEPDIELPAMDHVVENFDKYMERHVHIRRPLPFVAVVDELAGMIPHRIGGLRSLVADSDGDPIVDGPLGERPLSKALPIRIFDLWAHEQDLRRAVGMSPRIEGPAAALAMSQALLGWSRGLPATVKGIDTDLRVELTGPEPSSTTIKLGSGGPETVLEGDLGQLTKLFCGRGEPDTSLFTGDASVVAAIAPALGMTP